MTEFPETRLAGFLGKFTPEIEARASAIIGAMRSRLPGAWLLVYDNYNALAVGFSPSQKTGEVVFSIAVYPRWVSLFFFHGAKLADPYGRLKGSGNRARHIVLSGASDLDDPIIVDLMGQSMRLAQPPFDPAAPGEMAIKSVSATQRPRRPA
jgi:hypothetical protein